MGLEPTDELVEFFSWQGGMGGDSLTLGQLWIMPGFLPLSITDAVQMYRLYADGPDWLPRWFPVFEDQAGWFYAYDLGEFRGAVVLFQHETGQYPYVFESLAAMFSTHRAALDRGAISVDSEGVLEQDYERLSAVAKELNPKVPWWSLPE
ncbi:MAG: hypothetical protein CVT64_09680 [Actinobacteria bacterium HGW-Actinobacteria-4]|nr:MAG: hypothetical protein CVT64_09680 [Actinobacteria bacterium HGW-Actinobacteria-4]